MGLIRELNYEEINSVQYLFGEIDKMHRDIAPTVFKKPKGPNRNAEYLKTVIEDENQTILIHEQDNTVSGLIQIAVKKTSPIPILKPRTLGIIDTIIVSEKYQAKGIGKQLYIQAIQWFRKKNVTFIELNVWRGNDSAIRFYEKQGFRVVSKKMSINISQT